MQKPCTILLAGLIFQSGITCGTRLRTLTGVASWLVTTRINGAGIGSSNPDIASGNTSAFLSCASRHTSRAGESSGCRKSSTGISIIRQAVIYSGNQSTGSCARAYRTDFGQGSAEAGWA